MKERKKNEIRVFCTTKTFFSFPSFCPNDIFITTTNGALERKTRGPTRALLIRGGGTEAGLNSLDYKTMTAFLKITTDNQVEQDDTTYFDPLF